MKIETHGFKEASKRLLKFKDKYKTEQKKALQDISIQIVADAKVLVPIVVGNLKRSINFDPPKEQGNKIVGKVGAAAGYAHYVEFGSDRFNVRFPGRYYLRNAINKNASYMRERMSKVLKDAIVKI